MAALPSLLRARGVAGLVPEASGRSSTVRQSLLARGRLCARDAVALHSVLDSGAGARLDASPVRAGAGLDAPSGCAVAVGVGAAAAAAGAAVVVAFPHHAAAAEVASSLDAWSALVASEPKNALSLPTWIIHVASVAEWVLESVLGSREVQGSLRETELTNALSLPTWFIHVATVAEWITAMALVWRYGDTPGNSTWKGLSWGMVPLLGGAMCACTWHFFYNAQSLEILVVLQAALTVIGNFTMWVAAFRIYQSSQKQSKSL